MLIGTYPGILSPKRRTAIPKKFLDEIGQSLVVAKWYEGCLVLVSKQAWIALLTRITGEARTVVASVRDTERFILGSAFEIACDNQGRTVLPANLCTYAGLSKNVVYLGLGDRVEIWNQEIWEAKEKTIAKEAAKTLENLANAK